MAREKFTSSPAGQHTISFIPIPIFTSDIKHSRANIYFILFLFQNIIQWLAQVSYRPHYLYMYIFKIIQ